jgi:beta-glucanase (GH16 family)
MILLSAAFVHSQAGSLPKILTKNGSPKKIIPMPKKPSQGNWRLVLRDDFNGKELDRSKMEIWDWADTMDGERDLYYTPDDVYTQNPAAGKYQGRSYTSGKITSRRPFTYGKFKIRAKLPRGRGIHPAFWLSGAKRWPPEIDIFELIGQEPGKLYFSNHFNEGLFRKHVYEQGSYTAQEDLSKDFHTFALEWESSEIRWYVDDVLRFKTDKNVPNEPMTLILNTAAGSAWAGQPDKTTVFPEYFTIDYIEIFSNHQP